tara:strand:+ start:610 stop:795 length:186 start_codon:yes stop_codon:yes gene_type:complete
MKEIEINKLVELRTVLINKFSSLKDYKGNKNAIMRERDHAMVLHETIVKIDDVLKDYVKFS